MKILVCSDSHGDTQVLEKLFYSNQDCNLFLHCGDSGLPKYLTSSFVMVKGNCDFFDYPLKRDIKTKWGTIHMEHGDAVYFDKKSYIENLHCFIFLFGHTHVKEHGFDGKTYVFNPGSLTRPRDGDSGSYLIINIDDESGILTYKFHQINL
jgi:putative phosphoesterase